MLGCRAVLLPDHAPLAKAHNAPGDMTAELMQHQHSHKLESGQSHSHLDSIWLWFAQHFVWRQACQLLLPDALHVLNHVRERAQLLGSVTQEAEPLQQSLAAAAAAGHRDAAAQQQILSAKPAVINCALIASRQPKDTAHRKSDLPCREPVLVFSATAVACVWHVPLPQPTFVEPPLISTVKKAIVAM
jgi:hypothetical protein